MKLWIARYWHRHGSDLYLFWQDAEPEEEAITAAIEEDSEEDVDLDGDRQGYEMYGPYTVPEAKPSNPPELTADSILAFIGTTTAELPRQLPLVLQQLEITAAATVVKMNGDERVGHDYLAHCRKFHDESGARKEKQ
jgi:hypothetical protein